jgi:hypothetical protein
MIPDLFTFILLGIIIVLLQSYIRLNIKHHELKLENDYMANHLLEIYKGLCRLKKTSKKAAVAPTRAKKAMPKKSPKPQSKAKKSTK